MSLYSQGLVRDDINALVTADGRASGVWDYRTGSAGTVVLPAGARVRGIAASTTTSPGTLMINGGTPTPIAANDSIEIEPSGNLVAPTIIFDSTVSYFVEFVT